MPGPSLTTYEFALLVPLPPDGARETFRHRKGGVPGHVDEAVRRASRLHQGWLVALRYHSGMVSPVDAQAFLRDAGWFGARAHELWR
jgi:hypothetical protein